jgi:hypothetical protein
MIALLALGFPVVLLGLMLAMDRVEAPLRDVAIGDHLAEFLDGARADEVEAYVREGLARPLDRYWHRRHRWPWLPSRKLATRG